MPIPSPPWYRVEPNTRKSGIVFAFKPQATEHLAKFTHEIIHREAPLWPGLRDLIAAFTSARNHYPF